MKKFLSFLLLVLTGFAAHAQEPKPDKLVKISGDTLRVNVAGVTEQEVSFTYPGEKMTNTLSKNQIKEILFANGRVEKLSQKVIITGEQDWAKVLVTTSDNDVKGLVRKGEVRAKATGMTTMSSQANIDARATEKLKREAARLGAHIILVQNQTSHAGIYGLTTPGSLKQGVAYGYQ